MDNQKAKKIQDIADWAIHNGILGLFEGAKSSLDNISYPLPEKTKVRAKLLTDLLPDEYVYGKSESFAELIDKVKENIDKINEICTEQADDKMCLSILEKCYIQYMLSLLCAYLNGGNEEDDEEFEVNDQWFDNLPEHFEKYTQYLDYINDIFEEFRSFERDQYIEDVSDQFINSYDYLTNDLVKTTILLNNTPKHKGSGSSPKKKNCTQTAVYNNIIDNIKFIFKENSLERFHTDLHQFARVMEKIHLGLPKLFAVVNNKRKSSPQAKTTFVVELGKRAYSPQEIQDQNHPKKLITYLERERKNNFWSDEEEQKLIELHAAGILADERAMPLLRDRSNTDLKDKVVNLSKAGRLQYLQDCESSPTKKVIIEYSK